MASKKTSKKPKVEPEIVEGKPVVPVVFRRSFTGYPKAGETGYMDADLFVIWEKKGHVYRAIDVVRDEKLLDEVKQIPKPVKVKGGGIMLESGENGLKNLKIEVRDEVDSERKP